MDWASACLTLPGTLRYGGGVLRLLNFLNETSIDPHASSLELVEGADGSARRLEYGSFGT